MLFGKLLITKPLLVWLLHKSFQNVSNRFKMQVGWRRYAQIRCRLTPAGIQAIADTVVLQTRLLYLWKPGFGLAQIQHQVRTFDSLDRAVDLFADAARVFLIDRLPLGRADFLKDYLFGCLGTATRVRLT